MSNSVRGYLRQTVADAALTAEMLCLELDWPLDEVAVTVSKDWRWFEVRVARFRAALPVCLCEVNRPAETVPCPKLRKQNFGAIHVDRCADGFAHCHGWHAEKLGAFVARVMSMTTLPGGDDADESVRELVAA